MIYSTNLLKVNLPESKYFFYWDKMRNQIETQIYGKTKDERSENLKKTEKTLEQKIENLSQSKYLVLDLDEYLGEVKMQIKLENTETQNELEKFQNSSQQDSDQNIQNLVNFICQIQKKLKNLKVFVISNCVIQIQNQPSLVSQNSDSEDSINLEKLDFLHKLNYTVLNGTYICYPDSSKDENKNKKEQNNKEILKKLAMDNKIQTNQISVVNITLDKINNARNVNITKLEITKNLDLDLGLLTLWKNNSGELRKQLILTLDLYLTFLTRDNILTQNKRVDGRPLDQTREIKCQIGVLPHNHGSSLFARGETQVLNVLTLGTTRDGQTLDDMENYEEETKNYIHHYNFPSYSVGETGRYFGPGRREIGHGALAEKALLPVLPSLEKFPYTMRLVSECLGSNGSTSMASTCASTLSLLQGGVPITDSVAGVAMGLVLANR